MDEGSARLRTGVAALVGLEALGLLGLAVYMVVQTAVATASDTAGALALAGVLVLIGTGVGVCAWGVLGGRRWSRSPAVTWQIVQAGIGMPLSASARWYVGIPVLAVAVVALFLLLTRRVIPPEPAPEG